MQKEKHDLIIVYVCLCLEQWCENRKKGMNVECKVEKDPVEQVAHHVGGLGRENPAIDGDH